MTISVKNVSAGYGGIDVINDISMDVVPGRSVCILGPNGCGKTTLLRVICGFLPFKGTIKLDGVAINKISRLEFARKVALLGQLEQSYFGYTVYESVMVGRYSREKRGLFESPTKQDKTAVEQAILRVGLERERDKKITHLSGGQLQRVFLARAFAQQPKIMLLDEPTNHLDLVHQLSLIDYLRQWAAEGGRSVICVMHDINLALRLSDDVVLMHEGNIAAAGSARDTMTRENLARVYGMDVRGVMREMLGKWNEIT